MIGFTMDTNDTKEKQWIERDGPGPMRKATQHTEGSLLDACDQLGFTSLRNGSGFHVSGVHLSQLVMANNNTASWAGARLSSRSNRTLQRIT